MAGGYVEKLLEDSDSNMSAKNLKQNRATNTMTSQSSTRSDSRQKHAEIAVFDQGYRIPIAGSIMFALQLPSHGCKIDVENWAAGRYRMTGSVGGTDPLRAGCMSGMIVGDYLFHKYPFLASRR